MPALAHLTEQALHRAGHDRAQKAQLCVATVAQSTCPRSTPGGSARGYQGADRPLSRPVCPINSRPGCICMHHQTCDEYPLLPHIGRGQGWRVAPRATSAVTLCDRKRRGGTVHHFADASPRTIPRHPPGGSKNPWWGGWGSNPRPADYESRRPVALVRACDLGRYAWARSC